MASDGPVPRHTSTATLVRREVVVLLAGLCAIMVAVFGVWYVLAKLRSPEAVVRRFIDADIHGRYAEQRQCIEQGMSSSAVLTLFQQVRKQLGHSLFDKYRITDITRTGDSATVDVEIPAPSFGIPSAAGTPPAQTITIAMAVVRHGDDWRIQPEQTLANALPFLLAQGWQSLGLKLPPGLPSIPGMGPGQTGPGMGPGPFVAPGHP